MLITATDNSKYTLGQNVSSQLLASGVVWYSNQRLTVSRIGE